MLTARETLKKAASNKFKRWIPATESETGDSRSASARLGSGEYVAVSGQPRFSIKPTDRIFTIGSCFARNIENSLIANGIELLTASLDVDARVLAAGQLNNTPASIRTILNKYSTRAIRDELDRAFSGSTEYPFIEVQDGLFIDPHLALVKPLPLEDLTRVRSEVNRVIRSVEAADIVFMTLGLTETWFDAEKGCYLNAAPPPSLLSRDKGRFLFENSSVNQAIEDVEKILALLRSMNQNIRVLLTVSPVPMNTTFTSADVLTANTYSKAVLRVTAQHMFERYEFVDYFPSYEMVVNSPRQLAWATDQLHVRSAMVDFVVNNFISAYISGSGEA